LWLGHRREAFELLSLGGGSADGGGRGDAVDVIAVGVDLRGEVAGVPLPLEGVVHDGPGGSLAPVEAGGGPLDGGLVPGDVVVEHSDLRGNVALPSLLRVGLSGCPGGRLLARGVTVPPAGGVPGGRFGPLPLGLGLGEVPDGQADFGGLPDAPAGVQVGSGLSGLL
jgi:hypothetical protein